MERTAANQHGPSPAPVHVSAAITTLQHHVQAWIDGDRLLPADGADLLALLGHALEALAAGDAPAVHAGITACTRQIEALITAGVLTAGDSQPAIELVAALLAELPSSGGPDP